MASTQEGHAATQSDTGRPEKWADKLFMQHKEQCVPLPMEQQHQAPGLAMGKQLDRIRPGDPGGHQVERGLRRLQIFCCIEQKYCQKVKRGNPFSPSQHR